MVRQIIIKNLLISYQEFGGGDSNRTLLFLHGWRSNKEVWGSAIQRLKDSKIERFAIYALDLPGFGGSQSPTTPPRMHSAPLLEKEGSTAGWTVRNYADVVAGFIKKLKLKNVVIVGHSFGGRVGIKLASTHPELISKLVLVDSAGFPMEALKKKLAALAAKIVRPIFKPQMMQGLRKKIYKKIGAEDYLATPELQKTFVNITSEDLSPDLKNIKAPTLIISGENDQATPIEFGRRMQSLISNSIPSSDGMVLSNDRAKFIILKNAGHFSFLDKPGEFVEAVEKFI